MAPKSKQHSPIGASNSHRWMECPGSVALEAKFPSTSSPYAIEGTGAHRLGEKCILSGKNTSDFVGSDMLMEDGTIITVTQDMADAVQVCVDYIRKRAEEYGVKPEVEKRLHLSWIHPRLYGTADYVISDAVLGRMLVVDYKHGQGVAVFPEENSQAMIYALGAVGDGEGPETYPEVEIVIVQPRANGPAIKSWMTSGVALDVWGQKVLGPAAKRAMGKNQPLKSGEWCRFCRAAGSCPEQMRSALQVAGETFQPVDLAKGELPDPSLIAPEELGRILSLVPRFEQWVADVRARVEQDIASGRKVPGWKLVQGRSNRKWIDEEKAREILVSELGSDALTVPALKSPAQIEATLKKWEKGIPIGNLVHNPPGKATLAPETDNRPALVADKATDIFTSKEINNE